MSDIPGDKRSRDKLVQKVALRYLNSVQFHVDEFDKFRRLERWWKQVLDDANAGDEYAITLGFAFSLVENMHAKITEPLFQMGLPFDTYPRKLGHTRAATNMQHIQRAFYQGPNFQQSLSRSKKSMCIVGHRWEFDEWVNIEYNGKMWGMAPRKIEVERGGKKFSDVVMVPAEVPVKRKQAYGFMTKFPRWDQVHPEPGRSTIDTGLETDMTWVIRDLGYQTLESLAKEMVYDPNSKSNVPLYDFGELLHHYGRAAEERYKRIMDGESGSADNFGAIITPDRGWDYQASRYRSGRGDDHRAQSLALEDRDKLWIVEHREMGEILTIAQGRFVIKRRLDPWHKAGLKCRIENYMDDGTGRLYGKGAIEPVEGELGELDDMHALSMQNIFRTVNRMTYVKMDAIVNQDDFDRRAGGLVRIKGDQAVGDAVSESTMSSPIQEMLTVESELRGIIEKVSSDFDGSPGVQGTKQSHKTAKGMEAIINSLSPIYSRFQRSARINEVRRAMNMADFCEQFQFEKQNYRIIQPNGSTAFIELDRADIDTQGIGFDFGYNMDPSWGNPQQRLLLKRQVYADGQAFNALPDPVKGPNAPHVNLPELLKDILQESGYVDTSNIFQLPGGEMKPEYELAVLSQGGTVDGCKGDLVHHIQTHWLQHDSPALEQAMASGKAAPDTKRNLELLIEQDMRQLATFLRDPRGAAMDKLKQAGGQPPMPGQGGK